MALSFAFHGLAAAPPLPASRPPPIVWEHHPRFRTPPRPAVYPPRAIELGQQGEALVRVRLEPSGAAAEILLWRGTGYELLDKAALAAVRLAFPAGDARGPCRRRLGRDSRSFSFALS